MTLNNNSTKCETLLVIVDTTQKIPILLKEVVSKVLDIEARYYIESFTVSSNGVLTILGYDRESKSKTLESKL